jgi:hypothetical protein
VKLIHRQHLQHRDTVAPVALAPLMEILVPAGCREYRAWTRLTWSTAWISNVTIKRRRPARSPALQHPRCLAPTNSADRGNPFFSADYRLRPHPAPGGPSADQSRNPSASKKPFPCGPHLGTLGAHRASFIRPALLELMTRGTRPRQSCMSPFRRAKPCYWRKPPHSRSPHSPTQRRKRE